MDKILELREKRANIWDKAKAFLDNKRDKNGILSAEDTEQYEKMETEVVNLGKEIDRLERQATIDLELSKATTNAILNKPNTNTENNKTGRESKEYNDNFWKALRSKNTYQFQNALKIGTDSEGGYLVPDEFEKKLVEALKEENIFRKLAKIIKTSSGDRKIPVVATKGTASWVDEEGAIKESDDTFSQVSIGAYKLATMIKVSEELLNDSVFNKQSYIKTEFAKKKGNTKKETFLIGYGKWKPK